MPSHTENKFSKNTFWSIYKHMIFNTVVFNSPRPMMHVCIQKSCHPWFRRWLCNKHIFPDYGLPPVWRQTIFWTNARSLSNRPMGTKYNNFQKGLTLNVQGPSHLGLTRSISSWLLMPWLLASPGHQQPWYWLRKMSKSCSHTRKDFNYLWYVSMEEWHKM